MINIIRVVNYHLFSRILEHKLIFLLLFNRYLKDNLGYIDDTKICIWGWSFGGYVAGMALAKDNENIFKCALSVAPVTDWIYYGLV